MQIFINFLLDSLVFALAAVGLAVIFGLIRVINLAHGALLMVGAYLLLELERNGISFGIAVAGAAVGTGVLGAILEVTLVRYFYDKPDETLLLTYAIGVAIVEALQIIFTSNFQTVSAPFSGSVAIAGAHVSEYQVFVAICTFVLLGAIALIVLRTPLGTLVRATIENPKVASLLGVNIRAVYRSTFVAGALIAGLAGALIAPIFSISPDSGTTYVISSFFIVITGGAGSLVSGTMIGGALIGGGSTLIGSFQSQVVAQTAVYAIAAVILRWAPEGIARKVRMK